MSNLTVKVGDKIRHKKSQLVYEVVATYGTSVWVVGLSDYWQHPVTFKLDCFEKYKSPEEVAKEKLLERLKCDLGYILRHVSNNPIVQAEIANNLVNYGYIHPDITIEEGR